MAKTNQPADDDLWWLYSLWATEERREDYGPDEFQDLVNEMRLVVGADLEAALEAIEWWGAWGGLEPEELVLFWRDKWAERLIPAAA